jgi:uncharacterized membrane protein
METIRHEFHVPNMGTAERIASLIAGALLVSRALTREKSLTGVAAGLAGVALLRHGITGFSYTRRALGINTAHSEGPRTSIRDESGIRVDEAITINCPREEVYRFWRDLSNISQFMENVESVSTVNGGNRSHWVAKGPRGKSIEWDAEIINEKENELIAWRSLEGADIPNAGSVHFKDVAGGRGTEVNVELQYAPPGGAIGAFVARAFGEDPSSQIRDDLRRLKTRLEAGVLLSTDGQPVGAQIPDRDAPHSGSSHGKDSQSKDEVAMSSEQSFPASDAPAYTH